ncbi:hypothetical protein LSCM1_05386 [Leishmania martiniquensis]|uniref:Leucine-rich repeat protein (LRRP) n=1 Tax=Leishmania martiniquensis TaxID=1580590 RepID=A0A836GKZ7_9TRYP|nr:hypothetical protein LSCM1_05386 [Leishmania martiniquensis]
MRAGTQQRYDDILRRQTGAYKRALRCGPALVTAPLSGNGTHPLALSTRVASSGHSGSGHEAELPPAFRSHSAACVCDPLVELGIPLAVVPSVVEYVCDRRGFTSLHPNFLRFEHLRRIVVERNAFTTLHNLILPAAASRASPPASAIAAAVGPPLHRGCRRLTHLHAAYNCISDIAGDTDIPRLSLLEHLSLAHNRLTDLDKVLRALKRLRSLRFLDLRGNPVTGEPRYRERCVAALPQLEVLDCRSVTPKEREAAAAAAAAAAATARWHQCTHGDSSHSTSGGTNVVSSMQPCSLPSHRKATRAAVDLFSKSLTAMDLARSYEAHLRQQRQAQEVARQSSAAARRQEEEAWESFHAIWTLSQPGMPLSADGWQRTQMAAAAAAALEGAEGDGGGPEAQNCLPISHPSPRLPASSSVGASAPSSPLRAGRKQMMEPPLSLAAATTTAAATLAPVSGGIGAAALNVTIDVPLNVTIDVPLDRPLFPSRPATVSVSASAGPRYAATAAAAPTAASPLSSTVTATWPLPALHGSAYFGTIRGGAAALRKSTKSLQLAGAPAPAVSSLLPVEGPSPDRLAMLQRALQASAHVVRVSAARQGSLEELKKPAAELVVAAPERTGSGRRNVGPSLPSSPSISAVTAISIPVEFSALRAIQETKYAVIPPPWEGQRDSGLTRGAEEIFAGSPRTAAASPGATGASVSAPYSIGVVSATTTQQEALTEILVLLHEVYSLKELWALEGEYGGAELLRLLPLREWSAFGAENSAGESVSTAVAARQAMSALSRPGNAGNAASGGSGSGRVSPSSFHDRKRGAGPKGAAHGGNAKAGLVGAAAARGGSAEAAGGAQAIAAARAALPSEPQQVWQLLTGSYIVVGATPAGGHGVVVAFGKSSEDGGRLVTLTGKSSSSTSSSPTNSAPLAGATNGSSASAASSGAADAAIPAASLQDPEVVQHLVRPIGAYSSQVLEPLLALLQAPVAEADVQPLCDALAVHHNVHESVSAAAAAAALTSCATTAESQSRVASNGPRNKKESLSVTEDGGSAEAKSKKVLRASASAALSDAASAAPLSSALSATSPPARSSVKAAQALLQQQQRHAIAPQLTLTGVLTALLFSPTFVRARVAYLEEKLSRMAAVASSIIAAGHAGQKGSFSSADSASPCVKSSSAATALSCLFHRMQAVKMHAARIDAALVAAGPSATANEALRFLDPEQVLVAYSGRP